MVELARRLVCRVQAALSAASQLLGCSEAALRSTLCTKQINAAGEWIELANPPEVAAELCDGLAKLQATKLQSYKATKLQSYKLQATS